MALPSFPALGMSKSIMPCRIRSWALILKLNKYAIAKKTATTKRFSKFLSNFFHNLFVYFYERKIINIVRHSKNIYQVIQTICEH